MRVTGGAEGDAEGGAAEATFHAMSAVRAGGRLPLASSPAAEVRWTQPPPHLSEAELLGLMEEHGVGTDASMAQHVLATTKEWLGQILILVVMRSRNDGLAGGGTLA